MCNHHPIFCVIPPHILCAMVENGEAEHKAFALNTLIHTERLRGHRQVLSHFSLKSAAGNKDRVVENAAHTENLTGNKVVRSEGQGLTGDQAVDEAYAYTGATYDFYWDVFHRNSIDGKGMKLISVVHFGKNFDNAFWNGSQMTFGDGDGKVFERFTKCPEVIGHELTHGVTEDSSSLIYQGQAGALNEAISDVFGSLVKQKLMNQTADQADWVIGAGLFTPEVNGVGVRDIKNPGEAYDDKVLGKDPCPSNMGNYVHTTQDNGGIHINCTIPSHAFYLSAVEVGGFAWQKVGRVWYNTVTKRLKKKTNFVQFADMTLKAAMTLFGRGSQELKAVKKGWKSVGVI